MRYLFLCMLILRLQTSIVWFLSLFSEGLMCMRQNFKLFCCVAYTLNLIVSIFLSCWPNLWCSGVFSAEFRSFRKNSAKPDISRKYGSASRIFWKIRLRGLIVTFGGHLSAAHKDPILRRVYVYSPDNCQIQCCWSAMYLTDGSSRANYADDVRCTGLHQLLCESIHLCVTLRSLQTISEANVLQELYCSCQRPRYQYRCATSRCSALNRDYHDHLVTHGINLSPEF